MKKTIIITITLLLVAAIAVGVVVYAANNKANGDIGSEQTCDANETDAKTDTNLETFWNGKKQKAGKDAFTLKEIYRSVYDLYMEGNPVSYNDNFYVHFFRTGNNNYFAAPMFTDTKIVVEIHSDVAAERDIYELFLASVTNCFKDFYYFTDWHFLQNWETRNMNMVATLFYAPDFKEFGYETAEEYYKAAVLDNSLFTDNAYLLGFDSLGLKKLVEAGNKTFNDYDSFVADALKGITDSVD
ncbi:MAG: hypothetical protein IK086_06370 [Clostridia bacterium]|nr:hypothetical protein [Clostridia bacterium]